MRILIELFLLFMIMKVINSNKNIQFALKVFCCHLTVLMNIKRNCVWNFVFDINGRKGSQDFVTANGMASTSAGGSSSPGADTHRQLHEQGKDLRIAMGSLGWPSGVSALLSSA